MKPHNNSTGHHERRRKRASVELERKWRGILARWHASGLSARAFIRAQQLPEASFYGWKRTLRLRDQERARQAMRPDARRSPARQMKRATSPATPTKRPLPHVKGSTTPAFVPLIVTPPRVPTAIELVLGDGRTLRVPVGFDATTLMRLLSALERP